MLILVQRPQHKSSSDPVGAPKKNPFGAMFIEFRDIKKCCTFSGLELVSKSRRKLIGALCCMHKGPKYIQTLWDHQKKIPFVETYKECAICANLMEKRLFWGIPRGSKRCCTCSGALKILPRGLKKCKSLGCIRKKRLFCRKSAILSIKWKFQF